MNTNEQVKDCSFDLELFLEKIQHSGNFKKKGNC